MDSSGAIVPDTLPPVVIESPTEGERVGSVVQVSGTANVYEAHVGLRVRDARGAIVRDTFAMATCGTGCRGRWQTSLVLPGPEAATFAIEAFAPSGEDGRPLHLVRVNVERQRWP